MSGNRVNQAIPSFINGVSQQPPTVRLASQCELLDNGLPTVSDGLRKRPPSSHMALLWTGRMDDAYTHAINRDQKERYKVFIAGEKLKVVDLFTGKELSVAFPDGTDYLAAAEPRNSFSAVTIADHTFIVNRNITAKLTSETTAAPAPEALIYVKHGYSATSYTATVDGSTVTYTTPKPTVVQDGSTQTNNNSQPSTIDIATQLASGLSKLSGFTISRIGSVVRIQKASGDFTFSVTDSWGEQALIGIKKQVAKFTDLPAKAFDGFKVRVTGESKGEDDDYFVEYNSEGSTRNGTWDECRGWSVKSKFDLSSMPHVLVREADGDFTFRQGEWEEARVGDDASCPPPSFIGGTISGLVFFRNRLGILSGENIILSRDAEFFNFWPKTASMQVATDPIDYASSHELVAALCHAVPFQDSLSLFSDQVQFQLTNGGAAAFSPETARLDIATQYDCSPNCAPVAAGKNVYFIAENKDNTSVLEYFVTADGVTMDATDVTAHVPRYIPHGVFKMISSTNDDFLMLISTTQRNIVWVYKFFWMTEEKVQSAWSRWVFPESDAVLSIANVGANIYLVVQRSDGVYLECINIHSIEPDEGMPFLVHLDRKVSVTGVYNAKTDRTTWTLPYAVVADMEAYRVILGAGFVGKAGREVVPDISGKTASASGRYDQAPCFIGRLYEFRIRLSEQFMRESKDVSAPVISEGRLQLLNFQILHRNSGYFYSEVTAKGRDTAVKNHLGTIGDGNFRIGQPVLDSLPHRFTVLASSSQVTIDIVNDKHYPSNLLSAEWTGWFGLDSQRV